VLVRLALEKGLEGEGFMCWGLDFPGCFSYGSDDAEALLKVPQALLKHEDWLKLHTDSPWFQLNDLDFRLVESFACHVVEQDGTNCEVNAFFADDLRPLSESDITQALLIFDWQRDELLAGIETLPADFLDRLFTGQRWSLNGILEHIASAERFYLKCVGVQITPPELSAPLELLEHSANLVREHLPGFLGSDLQTTNECENWTPRKFVRRLLWHQRDHINHIRELVDQYFQAPS
jgi:hypothetical protein